MYEALMIASAGITSQQRRLDTIADNLSNVNTDGFKASRLDFKDALYTAGIVPGLPRTPEGNQQKGHGVMVSAITKDFSNGNLITTGSSLDVAIEGEGFLELSDDKGNLVYTKSGSLTISNDGSGFYLMNKSGLYVLDENGSRIKVPAEAAGIEVDEEGVIKFVGENGELDTDEITRLGKYTFENVTGLVSAGRGNFAESAASGAKLTAEGVIVRQGMLEGSNVNIAEEMTRMIRTQRAFSLAARALTTADDMEGIANNLRK